MSHVLVIEDDPNNARLFELMLKRKGGFDVTVSEDIDRIFDLIEENESRIILMDVSLSNAKYQGKEIDGIGLTRILKTDRRTKHLPVIVVTAHAMSGDKEKLLDESGADDYISKPITDPGALIDKVAAHIS